MRLMVVLWKQQPFIQSAFLSKANSLLADSGYLEDVATNHTYYYKPDKYAASAYTSMYACIS